MALIGTIRKNSWLLIVVIGLALAAFIIMDMSSAGNRGGAVTSLAMGKIEGKTVDWNEFQGVENMLYSGSSSDVFLRRSQLWNYFVEEAIVAKQADALGLQVSKDELIDLQFGANKSPVIVNRFRNPQTGQVDVNTLNQFRQQIQGGTLPIEQKRFWAHQEKEIIKDRLQSKLNTMVSKALYTPTWMVEQTYGDQTQKIAFDFVKVPFSEVDDSEINLTDADFATYLANNKGTYMQDEETRRVDYVVFDVVPSAGDSAKYREDLAGMVADFESAENDTIFVENNYGTLNPTWLSNDDLPASIQEAVTATPAGKVYGPYLEGNRYQILKVLDRAALPDSSTTRHILINATDPASFAAADAKIDSIKSAIESGSDFEELAKTLSQDQGSAAKGGLYEKIPVNQFVPEYQEVMLNGDFGKLYKARTAYGVHLIEPISRSRETTERVKIALISQTVTPSEDTQNEVFEKANAFLAQNRTLDAMQASVAESGELTVETSGALKANDFSVGTLGTGADAREIVKFAYDGSVDEGDVSASVYTFQDPVELYINKYVVAGLKGVQDAGMPSVASIKDEIEALVRNQKKGEALKAKISGSDLNAIASQFDSEVENAKDVTFDATFVPGLGNEPKVMAEVFNMDVNSVSQPIVGNSGVYVVKLNEKPAVGTAFNIPQLRKNSTSTAQTQVTTRLMQAMKKNADVEDLRSKFY
ncbi:MAG: peptidylprolyl isomerase [Bacteroidota bacterium]